jgi:hypothetical protein
MISKYTFLLLLFSILFFTIQCTEKEVVTFNEVCELSDELREISGIIPFNENLLAFGDGGSAASLYEISSGCDIVSEFKIIGASNSDWEAIAEGDSFIYIGNFGNNAGSRKNLEILKIEKRALSDSTQIFSRINFSYEDQLEFGEDTDHNFDCEAFFIDGVSIFLITKNRGNNVTHVYELNTIEENQLARRRADLEINELVTDAFYDRSNEFVLISSYANKVFNDNTFRPSFYLLDYSNKSLSIEVSDENIDFDAQVESICIFNDSIFIASEAETSGNAILYSVNYQNYINQF